MKLKYSHVKLHASIFNIQCICTSLCTQCTTRIVEWMVRPIKYKTKQSSATKSQKNRRLRRVVRTAEWIIGTTLPTLQELHLSRVSTRAGKITLDPHIQHIYSSNCYCLVNATEFWAPERPDTETVSSLKQSISWTLDNNYSTQTIYTLIYLKHILSLHFNCT